MVTVSMRRQTNAHKRRDLRDEEAQSNRLKARDMLKQKCTIREIMATTLLSNGTIMRIKHSMKTNDQTALNALLNPRQHRAGARTTLTHDKENVVKSRIKDVARRGFAIDVATLRSIMGAVANDGRKGFKNGVPTKEVIRSFRARHRDLTCRNYEKKELAKLKGESVDHVKSFENALKKVQKNNPDIYARPELYWNLDETKVSGEFGKKTKVFRPADTSHGGFRSMQAVSRTGKHLTAIVVASAAGHVLPPFFVFAGKNQMQNWFEPLHAEIFKDETGIPHWLARENWFPGDSFVVPSLNGSMEKDLLPFLIEHVNKHARKHVPQHEKIVLKLDGHSSRNGWDWLEACVKHNIEVVQSPANTSHFLQPCDQYINKHYQETIRETVDYLSRFSVLDFTNMGLKLKLGVAGYHALTPNVIRRSFETTGLWPMDFRFVEMLRKKNEDSIRTKLTTAWQMRPTTAKRRTDLETRQEIQQVCSNQTTPSSVVIEKLSNILNQHSTITSILDTHTIDKRPNAHGRKQVQAPQTREVFSAGTPALYLTHAELIRKRKERQAADELAKQGRESEKERRQEEKTKKQAEKKAEMERKKKEKEAKRELVKKRKAVAEHAKALKKVSKRGRITLRNAPSNATSPTNGDKNAASALIALHDGASKTPNHPI